MAEFNIVLIDSDFYTRHILSAYLNRISKELGVKLNIFSSQNRVEGLGLAYITKPDLIILNADLPKYSNTDLIEFILSNPDLNKKTTILHVLDDKFKNKLPHNYITFNRNAPNFLKLIVEQISKTIAHKASVNKSVQFSARRLSFANSTLKLANKAQILRHTKTNIYKNIFKAFILSIVTNLSLFALRILLGHTKDQNIEQYKLDLAKFRIKVYPTTSALAIILTLVLIQAPLILMGSVTLLNTRIVPISASSSNQINVDFEEAVFDPEQIIFEDSLLKLKPIIKSPTVIPTIFEEIVAQPTSSVRLISTTDVPEPTSIESIASPIPRCTRNNYSNRKLLQI